MNIPNESDISYLAHCYYSKDNDTFCPIFQIKTIVQEAGEDFQRVSIKVYHTDIGTTSKDSLKKTQNSYFLAKHCRVLSLPSSLIGNVIWISILTSTAFQLTNFEDLMTLIQKSAMDGTSGLIFLLFLSLPEGFPPTKVISWSLLYQECHYAQDWPQEDTGRLTYNTKSSSSKKFGH